MSCRCEQWAVENITTDAHVSKQNSVLNRDPNDSATCCDDANKLKDVYTFPSCSSLLFAKLASNSDSQKRNCGRIMVGLETRIPQPNVFPFPSLLFENSSPASRHLLPVEMRRYIVHASVTEISAAQCDEWRRLLQITNQRHNEFLPARGAQEQRM
jgi:hypothetical protein